MRLFRNKGREIALNTSDKRKKVTFLHEGVGPRVSEKFEFLYGSLDQERFVEVPLAQADYLFYTPFTPEHHAARPDTIKIMISGENIVPDFNACDYAISGEFMEFGDRYLRIPVYAMDPQAVGLGKRTPITADILGSKDTFCNFIYSNAQIADPIRLDFFHALNAEKRVVSAGRLERNYFGLMDSTPGSDWSRAKRDFIENCRFTIAIENAEQPGYITEKVTDPLLAHSIPVYWGDPRIADEINPKAFFHIRDYETPDYAIRELLTLETMPERQLEIQNAPVFTGGLDRVIAYKDAARAFFDAIFDQPISSARRRPRHGMLQGMEEVRRADQRPSQKKYKRNRF